MVVVVDAKHSKGGTEGKTHGEEDGLLVDALFLVGFSEEISGVGVHLIYIHIFAFA